LTGCGRLARAALARRVGSAALVAPVGTVVAPIRPGIGSAAILARVGTLVAAVGPGIGGGALPLVGTRGGAAILRRHRRPAGLLAARTAGFLTVGTLRAVGAIRPLLTIRALRSLGTVRPLLALRTTLRPALLRLGPLPLLGLGPFARRRRALARLLAFGPLPLRLGPLLPGLGPLLPGLRALLPRLRALARLGSGRRALLPGLRTLLPGFGPFLPRLRSLGRTPLGARAATLAARAPGSAAGTAGPTLAASRSSRSSGATFPRPTLGQTDRVVASRRRVAGKGLAGKSLARKNGLEQQRRQDRAGQQQRAGRAHQEEPLVRRRSLRTP
jgi:hypothetical protein